MEMAPSTVQRRTQQPRACSACSDCAVGIHDGLQVLAEDVKALVALGGQSGDGGLQLLHVRARLDERVVHLHRHERLGQLAEPLLQRVRRVVRVLRRLELVRTLSARHRGDDPCLVRFVARRAEHVLFVLRVLRLQQVDEPHEDPGLCGGGAW